MQITILTREYRIGVPIFNEALNVIASERSQVNLLSFTIRRHGAVRLFSRNQSAGGLHLISSYVTPCK